MKPDDQDQLRQAGEIKSAVSDSRDGWWFRAVLDAFAFLGSDFGYRVTKVHQHFRGNYVRFDGATFALVIAYDTEDRGSTAAEL